MKINEQAVAHQRAISPSITIQPPSQARPWADMGRSAEKMKFARLLSAFFAVTTFVMIVVHSTTLPATSLGGWLTAPRITKFAAFDVAGLPSNITDSSWTSMWGKNRTISASSHPILSELEVSLQHHSRSGHVILRVTGDSEAEVNGFLATIQKDFERTYEPSRNPNDLAPHSNFHSSWDQEQTSFYWRQKYLWLLGGSFLVSILVTISLQCLHRRMKKEAEQE